jgi:hypothetical protein
MMRLRKTLLPLISVIISSLPQSSYKELMALYDAGILNLVSVDEDSYIESHDDEGIIYHYTDEGNKNQIITDSISMLLVSNLSSSTIFLLKV